MSSVSVTTTSANIIPATSRKFLILQNISDEDIYININGPVTVADGAEAGLRIKADGGSMSFPDLISSSRANDFSVHAIHGGVGSKSLRIIEG